MRPNNKVGFCPAVQLAPSSPLRSRPPHSVHHSGLIKPPLHAWSPVYLGLASAINAFLSDKQIRDSGSPLRLLKALSGSRRMDPKTFLSHKPGSGIEKTGLSGPQTLWPSLEEFFFRGVCSTHCHQHRMFSNSVQDEQIHCGQVTVTFDLTNHLLSHNGHFHMLNFPQINN